MTVPACRLAWLDIAKGLGMILVVVGHVMAGSDAAYAPPLATAIYAFHMPLFFLLAGFTLKQQAPARFALRKIAVLGLPYLAFLAALGGPALVLSCGFGAPQSALGIDTCPVLALKLLSGGSQLGGIFGVFWFVPCLFGGLVIAQLVLAARAGPARISAFVLLVCAAYLLPAQFPWSTSILSIGSVPMAAVLVLIGYALERANWVDTRIALVACTLFALATLIAGVRVDIKFADFGVPLFSMMGAVALSSLVIAWSKSFTSVPVLASTLGYVGRNTLPVLYLHQSVHLGLRLAGWHGDLLLIALSLAAPLMLQSAIGRSRAYLTRHIRFDLSRKSPRIDRPLE